MKREDRLTCRCHTLGAHLGSVLCTRATATATLWCGVGRAGARGAEQREG